MEEISRIEESLSGTGAEQRLNELDKLYEICESGELAVVAEALKAIARLLRLLRQRLLAKGEGTTSATGPSAGSKVADWLRQHHDAYHEVLLQLATSEDPRAQVCALRLAMASFHDEAARAGSIYTAGAGGMLPVERRIENLMVRLLLSRHWSSHLETCLVSEFVVPFVDLRHVAATQLKICLAQLQRAEQGSQQKAEPTADGAAEPPEKKPRRAPVPFADTMRARGSCLEDVYRRSFAILRELPEPPVGNAAPAEEEEVADDQDFGAVAGEKFFSSGRPAGGFVREYRRLFQDVWLQLLSLPVPFEQCRPLLQLVPSRVMPHVSQPLMLADFYLRAFHSESVEVSVLSLSGLFLLLTKHGLGDPETLSSSSSEFFSQLYSLLRPETFALSKRARFQRLLATSLRSGLLPARFAAAFSKKCLCLAAISPDPGTVMWLLAVAYSLIQKHYSHCSFLLHTVGAGDRGSAAMVRKDPFDRGAPLAAALEQVASTSLWEVRVLQHHHTPAVALLAKLFAKPFNKPSAKKLDPESFLDHSSGRLYQQALRSGDRQLAKWTARGDKLPLAYKVEDDALAFRVTGWAGALSTSQRRIGVDV